jgi:hypothetical protein
MSMCGCSGEPRSAHGRCLLAAATRSARQLSLHVDIVEVQQHDLYVAIETPIDLIEQIWSGTLDWSLADQISKSPTRLLQDFADQYNGLILLSRAPELGPGILRPEIRWTLMDELRRREYRSPIESGLDLLLYTHEILVDDPLDVGYLSSDSVEELRPYISRAVHSLALVRPLVKDGSMRFALLARARHPSYTGDAPGGLDLMVNQLQQDVTLSADVERISLRYGVDEAEVYQILALDVFPSIKLLRHWPKQFTPLMHGNAELQTMRTLVDTSVHKLSDGRMETLSKLANLTIPQLKGAVNQLVKMRQSEDVFAEWRAALHDAMRDVQEISENDGEWQSHARAILRDGLEPVRARASAGIRKSKFLSQATTGVRTLTFSGLGAAVGAAAAHGSAVGGFAGAAVAKSADIVWGAISALRERHQNKAVLDLIVSLEDGNNGNI